VVVQPSGTESTISAIENSRSARRKLLPRKAPCCHLEDDIDISRGDTIPKKKTARVENELGSPRVLDGIAMAAGNKYCCR